MVNFTNTKILTFLYRKTDNMASINSTHDLVIQFICDCSLESNGNI